MTREKRDPCERYGCAQDGTFGRCTRKGCPRNSDEAEQEGVALARMYAEQEAAECTCESIAQPAPGCTWHGTEAQAHYDGTWMEKS